MPNNCHISAENIDVRFAGCHAADLCCAAEPVGKAGDKFEADDAHQDIQLELCLASQLFGFLGLAIFLGVRQMVQDSLPGVTLPYGIRLTESLRPCIGCLCKQLIVLDALTKAQVDDACHRDNRDWDHHGNKNQGVGWEREGLVRIGAGEQTRQKASQESTDALVHAPPGLDATDHCL